MLECSEILSLLADTQLHSVNCPDNYFAILFPNPRPPSFMVKATMAKYGGEDYAVVRAGILATRQS